MIETIYKNRDNPITIEFRVDGDVIDFSAATRMVLEFEDSTTVADTSVDSSLIDWSLGNGEVQFNINMLDYGTSSTLNATLIVYDPTHQNGQILVHADSRDLIFKVK